MRQSPLCNCSNSFIRVFITAAADCKATIAWFRRRVAASRASAWDTRESSGGAVGRGLLTATAWLPLSASSLQNFPQFAFGLQSNLSRFLFQPASFLDARIA